MGAGVGVGVVTAGVVVLTGDGVGLVTGVVVLTGEGVGLTTGVGVITGFEGARGPISDGFSAGLSAGLSSGLGVVSTYVVMLVMRLTLN